MNVLNKAGRKKKGVYVVVAQIETLSGMVGYWLFHPHGYMTAIKAEKVVPHGPERSNEEAGSEVSRQAARAKRRKPSKKKGS